MSNREAVDQLLRMYDEYKTLTKKEAEISSLVARAKLKGELNDELSSSHQIIKEAVQNLSDSMTFANPIIWMMYKYEAYADEAQPIRTMADFRVHCSKPGYICTKRFTFLNEQLKAHEYQMLTNESAYPDHMELSDVIALPSINSLVNEESFQNQWNSFEYFKKDGMIKKWENYND